MEDLSKFEEYKKVLNCGFSKCENPESVAEHYCTTDSHKNVLLWDECIVYHSGCELVKTVSPRELWEDVIKLNSLFNLIKKHHEELTQELIENEFDKETEIFEHELDTHTLEIAENIASQVYVEFNILLKDTALLKQKLKVTKIYGAFADSKVMKEVYQDTKFSTIVRHPFKEEGKI